MRQAERADAETLLTCPDRADRTPKLAIAPAVRGRAARPPALTAAVDAALAAGAERPPDGSAWPIGTAC